MLKWIENYGYERQIEKANNGTALLPLDYKKFNALKRQGDYAGCDDLKDALDFFAVKDVGPAIHSLLQAFKLGMSRLNQVTMRSETWHIDFRVSADVAPAQHYFLTSIQKSPLRTLRIQPGDDHDSVGIYAKGKLLANFRLFECSKYFVSDLVMRQRLLSFIWQYGNDRIQERLKYEGLISQLCHTFSFSLI